MNWSRRRILLAAFTLIAALLTLRTSSAEAQVPALQFVDETTLSLEPESGIATTTVYVRNPTTDNINLQFRVHVEDEEGNEPRITVSPLDDPWTIEGASIQAYRLEFMVPSEAREASLRGYLIVESSDDDQVVAGSRALTLALEPPAALFSRLVFAIPLGVAVGTVLFATRRLRRKGIELSSEMLGSAEWDFSTSWLSTTGLATAFVSSALSGLISEDVNEGLAALGAVFAILLVVAPLVYNISITRVDASDNASGEVEYKGTVRFYLLASIITLWSVLGGLHIGYLLLTNIKWQELMGDPLPWLQMLPLGVGLLVVRYGVGSIQRTVVEGICALKTLATPPVLPPQDVEEAGRTGEPAAAPAQAPAPPRLKLRSRTPLL